MLLKKLTKQYHTLAFRLTLWYAAIFIISSFIAFLIFYLSAASIVQGRRDNEILEELEEFSQRLSSNGIDDLKREVIHESESEDTEEIFFQVLKSDGSEIIASDMSNWEDVNVDKGILNKLINKGDHVFKTLSLPGKPYKVRIVYERIGPDVIMQSGALLNEETQIMGMFKKVFTITMIMVSILATLVGWFMAKRALSGVEEVTRTAQKISRGRLDQRVPVKAREDEIERLASTFNHMLDHIQSLIKGMKEMSENIAHDLKSPITRMRGNAEVTLTTKSSFSEFKRMAASTIEEYDYLLEMINTMLDMSEIEAGVADIEIKPVDMSKLIRDACDLFEPLAENKNITIHLEVPDNLIVYGNLKRLQRMVANLLDNAVKFTPVSGKVSVSLYEDDKRQIILCVSDTGIGIYEDHLPHIFRRFYRCERSRSKTGSGLGLSLVEAIVKSHHGKITVKSQPYKGSEFTVVLPYLS